MAETTETKFRACVVVTARPSYSRIATALAAIRAHPTLNLQLILAGSALLEKYGVVTDAAEREGFPAVAHLLSVVEGENLLAMAKTTGLSLIELATTLDRLRPDVVVTIADRYETMATAIAAAYMNIPLVHVQGGETTGSIDNKVRNAITKLADLHLVATESAAARLTGLGEDPSQVVVTGCPSIDLAAAALENPALDFSPFDRYGGVGPRLDLRAGYIVALQHPVTTEHEFARWQVDQTLKSVHSLRTPTLWFWPNIDAGSDGIAKGIRTFRETHTDANMHFFKNMDPNDFLRILINARAIVGNSSVAIRECSFLGVPAVNIGSRQTGRERGPNVVDVPHDERAISRALHSQMAGPRPKGSALYGDGRAGPRIAEALVGFLRDSPALGVHSSRLEPSVTPTAS